MCTHIHVYYIIAKKRCVCFRTYYLMQVSYLFYSGKYDLGLENMTCSKKKIISFGNRISLARDFPKKMTCFEHIMFSSE